MYLEFLFLVMLLIMFTDKQLLLLEQVVWLPWTQKDI
jgi:hypothetical protein